MNDRNFVIEKVANMVFITKRDIGGDIIWKAWDISEFTERKLNNAKRKIESCVPGATFTRTFTTD